MGSATDGRPPRVMIVEDDVLIGLDLAYLLRGHGFDPQGPFKTADQALAAFPDAPPEMGVLDVNLGDGRTSEAVAHRLREARVPFLFLTGYGVAGMPMLNRFPDAARLPKPVEMPVLLRHLAAMQDRA